MQKLIIAIATFVTIAGTSALAADLPVKAPPLAPAVNCAWCGFYVGANGGWGWSHITASEAPFGPDAVSQIGLQSFGTGLNGGVFGGQIGYNWQAGNWVVGIEGDFDGASLNGANQATFTLFNDPGENGAFVARENIGWLASIRGRLGTTWGPGLAYVTGGPAWEKVTTRVMINADTLVSDFNQTGTASLGAVQSGFAVGAGYEWMIAPKWTVRAEYLFYGFDGGSTNTITFPGTCNSSPTCGVNVTTGHNNISVVRLGVNYMFNSAPGLDSASPVNLPTKAPHLALAPSWAGFYIGANGGWGWSHATASETPFGPDAVADIFPQSLGIGLNGGVFGGQIGYNWQIQNWVVGIEGDFDGASINGVSQVVFPDNPNFLDVGATNGFMQHENIGWLASIRGRLGTTWGPGLAYITGGAAWKRSGRPPG
jgi:outer membrane immunogenic protein